MSDSQTGDNTFYLTLTPRDPLVSRDGRPFGVGQSNRMRSTEWLLPSVVAGSLRTMLGKSCGGSFDAKMVEALKATGTSGPLPVVGHTLFLPRPADAVVKDVSSAGNARKELLRLLSLRPLAANWSESGCGCDLPHGLTPAMLPDAGDDDFKPGKIPAFWSVDRMAQWLANPLGADAGAPQFEKWENTLDRPEQDERTHVAITSESGAAGDSMLFSTCALDLSRDCGDGVTQLAVRVDASATSPFQTTLQKLNELHPCGGERRLVHWKRTDDGKPSGSIWELPKSLRVALEQADRRGERRIRLALASPGLFASQDGRREGWKPGWLKHTGRGFEGTPPGSSLTLRLVSAVVERWRPISGWSLERGKVGPKPVRRMVPSGATYFLEKVGGEGSLTELAEKLWLKSVCDRDQDRRDGFGLSAWGLWSEHSTRKE